MNKIIYWIILLLGCQQFPVLNITGSSFKLYDLFSGILLWKKGLIISKDKLMRMIYLLFVVLPLLSLIISYIAIGYPEGFFRKYSSDSTIGSLKFNYYFFPLFQYIMMILCYTAIINVYYCEYIYNNIHKLITGIVKIGSFIAIISLFNLFVTNIFHYVPSFISSIRTYSSRSQGFSIEPSSYVLYQSWIVLLCFYAKRLLKKRLWLILFSINILSLLLTLSSSLSIVVVTLIVTPFIVKATKKIRLTILISVIILLVGIFGLLVYTGYFDLAYKIMVAKLQNFFIPGTQTMDSGGFRSYTGRIGFKIGEDHLFTGVGMGMSIYHMYEYEFKMGILSWGEKLVPGIQPMNCFSLVFSEMGIFALIVMVLIFAKILIILRKHSSENALCKIFFAGAIINVGTFFSLYPVYSLYLWAWMILGVGYCRYLDMRKNDSSNSSDHLV